MAEAASELPINPDGSIYHLSLRPDEIARKVILVGDPDRAMLVASRFDEKLVEKRHREFVSIKGTCSGEEVLVIGTGIGAGNVEITMMELYALNEYDFENGVWKENAPLLTVLRIGTCGTPQPDIRPGDMAITLYSMGMDNMGQYYTHSYNDPVLEAVKKAVYSTPLSRFNPYISSSHPDVVSALEEKASEAGAKYHKGITVASPGFYAPQGRTLGRVRSPADNVQELYASLRMDTPAGELRIINNEMESSVINRICNILGYRSGMVAAVLAGRSSGDFLGPDEYRKAVETAVDIGLAAILDM